MRNGLSLVKRYGLGENMFSEVTLLLALLCSPDWSMRERTSSYLDQYPTVVLSILSMSDDPECSYRASASLRQRLAQEKVAYINSHKPIPWIDALPPDYPDRNNIISQYLDTVRDFEFEHNNNWYNYRVAMELYLLTLPLEEVKHLLTVTPKDRYWGGTGWIVPTVVTTSN